MIQTGKSGEGYLFSGIDLRFNWTGPKFRCQFNFMYWRHRCFSAGFIWRLEGYWGRWGANFLLVSFQTFVTAVIFVIVCGGEEHIAFFAAFIEDGDVSAVVDAIGAVETFIAAKCSVQFIFWVGWIDVWWGDVRAIEDDGCITALTMSGYTGHG